jgi:hypothetical protein
VASSSRSPRKSSSSLRPFTSFARTTAPCATTSVSISRASTRSSRVSPFVPSTIA